MSYYEISLYKLPILIAERILRQIWWIIRRRQKSRGYYLSEMIKLLINRAYEWKILNKLVNTNIQELENINFVYFIKLTNILISYSSGLINKVPILI